MASKEYLIISSSPPGGASTLDMSSSPLLPSLNELFGTRKPRSLQTIGGSEVIPSNASASFSTATSFPNIAKEGDKLSIDLVRTIRLDSESGILETTSKLIKQKPRKSAMKKVDTGEPKVAKKPRKALAKKDDAINDTMAVKQQRKPRAKITDVNGEKKVVAPRRPRINKVDTLAEAEDGTKAALPKRRKKKDEIIAGDDAPKKKATQKIKKTVGESQTKLARGNVTKPSSLIGGKEKVNDQSLDPFEDSLGLGLEEAVKRRVAWTPPALSANKISFTPGSILNTDISPSESVSSGVGKKGFTDLFGTYGLTTGDATNLKRTVLVEGTRKRKLIELVKTTTSAPEPAKEKGAKKKIKTITEHATAAYEADKDSAEPAPLLQYFSCAAEDGTAIDGFKVPPKPRSRSPTKKLPKNVRKLLSPASALKNAGNQDFVFGTSSQLAREDSPTFLKEIHEAMQASNQSQDSDPFASDLGTSSVPGMKSKATSKKRNLWAAAARDDAGDLHDVEMIDLAESPLLVQRPTTITLPSKALRSPENEKCNWLDIDDLDKTLTQNPPSTQPSAPKAILSEGWHDIDGLDENLELKLPSRQSPAKLIGPIEADIRFELLSSPLIRTPKASAQPSRSPKKDCTPTKKRKLPPKTKTAIFKDPAMPDYTTYTDARLAKQLKVYHFKPIKGRDAMILMLERCWEGKQRTALGAPSTNAMLTGALSDKTNIPTPVEASPKRPRGRPRKDSTATSPKPMPSRARKLDTVEYLEMESDTPLSQIRTPNKSKRKEEAAEDISDSDTPITPSPPRRQPSQAKTSPLPLRSATDLESSPELTPSEAQEKLFKHISQAVRSAAPATDSKNLSWHEKILLYDPIVLEDLTIWLNTGALEKIGWDGEVEPKEVKKWCESKSICCLWRENLRGGARSRY